jgi:hypothetical protein
LLSDAFHGREPANSSHTRKKNDGLLCVVNATFASITAVDVLQRAKLIAPYVYPAVATSFVFSLQIFESLLFLLAYKE